MLSDATLAETLTEMQSLYGVDQGDATYRQELFCDWTASTVLGSILRARDVQRARRRAHLRPGRAACPASSCTGPGIWAWRTTRPCGNSQRRRHAGVHPLASRNQRYGPRVVARRTGQGRCRTWMATRKRYCSARRQRARVDSGRSRIETMRDVGLKPMPAPHLSLQDGINAVRRTLPLCVFHPRCEEGGIWLWSSIGASGTTRRRRFVPVGGT